MASHILQVAYYPNLLKTRALVLESAGYQVTSVLGNNEAMKLDASTIATFTLAVVGFSAPPSVRTSMVLWFKARYPKIPVVALLSSPWERFPEADAATLSEDPKVWMKMVAKALKAAAATD